MKPRTKLIVVLGAFMLAGGGGEGGGCDCNCDWGSGTPPVHSDNLGQSGWVEPEPVPPITASSPSAEPSVQDQDMAHLERVETIVKHERARQTAVFCEKNPERCSPVPIKRVKVERGRWPEWYVRRTPGGNMHATWDCNHWPRGTNPVIKPGQEVGICGW